MKKLPRLPLKPRTEAFRECRYPIHQIDAPLARRWVIRAKRLRLNVQLLVGTGYLKLLEIRVLVEQLMMVRNASYSSTCLSFEPVPEAAECALSSPISKSKLMRAIAAEAGSLVFGICARCDGRRDERKQEP